MTLSRPPKPISAEAAAARSAAALASLPSFQVASAPPLGGDEVQPLRAAPAASPGCTAEASLGGVFLADQEGDDASSPPERGR